MSGSPLRTDTAQMASTSSTILTAADDAQAILAQIQGEVDGTAALWGGDAHTAYMGGTATIHADLQKSQVAMTSVSEKVGHSGTTYGSTDGTNASSLGNPGV